MYPPYASGGHHICKPCNCGSVTHAWRTTDRVAKSYTRVVFTSPCRPASISSARAVRRAHEQCRGRMGVGTHLSGWGR